MDYLPGTRTRWPNWPAREFARPVSKASPALPEGLMTNDDYRFDPEDLLHLVRNVRSKLPGGARTLGRVVAAALIIATLVGSYYQIEPDQVGVVMRFGRFGLGTIALHIGVA